MPISNSIPEARRDGVRTALTAAFGASPAGDMQPLSGGVSGALLLRFEHRNRPYVMRIEPERVALENRARGFACMAAAAKAGAAPPVHYCDAASGIAIMDFIAGPPLSDHPGGTVGLVRALGELIARVQSAPLFPKPNHYPELIAYLLNRLAGSGLFPQGQFDPYTEGLARIRAALPWDKSTLVSSHNDPNPRNILFDGNRLWLVDWELGFRNDRLVDVAIVTHETAVTPELEDALLEATFRRPPQPATRARLHIIRLLTRLFYGCVVLDSLAGRLQPGQNHVSDGLTPSAFRAKVSNGHLKPGTPETAHAFAKMSFAVFLAGVDAAGFEEMLKVVEQ